MRKNALFTVLAVLLLALVAGSFVQPSYWNRAVSKVNTTLGTDLSLMEERPFSLGLDLQGGLHVVYQTDLSQIPEQERRETLAGLRDVIERRINIFGITEPRVQVEGDRLVVELAGVFDFDEALAMIGETPFLEFREPRDPEETERILELQESKEFTAEDIESGTLDLSVTMEDPYFQPTDLTGKYLQRSRVEFDQVTRQPVVTLEFDREGSRLFEELTREHLGEPLAIYIDGELISSPVIQSVIAGGRAQISGGFTVEEARDLSRNLNAGALPIPIELLSQQTVGASLGEMSVRQSVEAAAYGFLAVLLFLILFYRIPGVIAGIALLVYVSLLLALFKIIPVTLTLAAIGGFILSIGIAVDANILIFSRIREELRKGKSFKESLEEGFSRAWPAVRDGNVTTLIVAGILFFLGTSFVKGFATTLVLGILLSLFSAVFFTRNFLMLLAGTKISKMKRLF